MFELAPPMTCTPLLAADFHLADMPAMHAMDVRVMVRQAMDGLRKDRLEIRPGRSNLLESHEPDRAAVHFESAEQARGEGALGGGFTVMKEPD